MYATAQDMLDRFGSPRLVQLTDVDLPSTGTVNATRLSRALEDASGEIDGYLVGRMALPLANPPQVLKLHCCTIAHFRLLGAAADEATTAAYTAAVAYLRQVAKGEILLTAPADVPTPAGLGPVSFVAGSKVMGREAEAYADGCGWSGL